MKVIAEIGSNWSTMDECIQSIYLAKACGADAVKFQLFTDMELYGLPNPNVAPYSMPPHWLKELKRQADKVGIEFMCTAFSVDGLKFVDNFVETHKLASSDLTHIRMLEALRKIGKPVLVSTGGHGEGDIGMALDILAHTDVTVMFCVSAYPAKFINFKKMERLKKFGRPVGYSDHSNDVLNIPWMAKQLGATVLEKHVNMIDAKGPDRPHSINPEEFSLMIKHLNKEDIQEDTSQEQDMVLMHNRRIIATRDIHQGEELIENINFGLFRSLQKESKALSPWAIHKLKGATALSHIKAGEGIGPFDFKERD